MSKAYSRTIQNYYFSPYMKYTRKIIHSVQGTVGSKFLFFQCKTANYFYSKINDRSRVRTTAVSSCRFRLRVSVVPNILTIYPKHFSTPAISEILRGSPTKFFGTVRQTIFDGNFRYSPSPFLSINFFATRNFLKHSTEGFLYEMFRYCETKNFDRKS